jgi:N-methylhydantoinase A
MLGVRYLGQSFELEIKWSSAGDVARDFHRAHRARYGYAQEENAVEIVSARLRSRGLVDKLGRERVAHSKKGTRGSASQPQATALVYFTTKPTRVAVYRREELGAGARLETPCIVTEYSSTTLVPASARAARIDTHGNLIIEL